MRLSLEQKLRTGHVKRWQIVRVAREQTIAEHMYRVYHIAIEIATALGLTEDQIRLVQDWALAHDLPEVVTGDIATPTKQAMRKAIPNQDPMRHIELSLDQKYTDLYLNLKSEYPLILGVVKMADTMEAINFLIIEGIGAHAQEVEAGLRSSLKENISSLKGENPDLPWAATIPIFYEVCGPARPIWSY